MNLDADVDLEACKFIIILTIIIMLININL